MKKENKLGKVLWFNDALGYGFIEGEDDGKSYFVHWKDVKMEGHRVLQKDQHVSFFPKEIEGKVRAVCVKVIDNIKTVSPGN